jgi:Xaa-Pro dipeptidase
MQGDFRDDRKLTYLNAEGTDKPLRSPVPHDVLERARVYRLSRIRKLLHQHDCPAGLFYDPVHTRYALDSSNMRVWTLHNPMRYSLIFTEGPAIMFELKGYEHLAHGIATIDEIRTAVT